MNLGRRACARLLEEDHKPGDGEKCKHFVDESALEARDEGRMRHGAFGKTRGSEKAMARRCRAMAVQVRLLECGIGAARADLSRKD